MVKHDFTPDQAAPVITNVLVEPGYADIRVSFNYPSEADLNSVFIKINDGSEIQLAGLTNVGDPVNSELLGSRKVLRFSQAPLSIIPTPGTTYNVRLITVDAAGNRTDDVAALVSGGPFRLDRIAPNPVTVGEVKYTPGRGTFTIGSYDDTVAGLRYTLERYNSDGTEIEPTFVAQVSYVTGQPENRILDLASLAANYKYRLSISAYDSLWGFQQRHQAKLQCGHSN